jgi:hypothetical protein
LIYRLKERYIVFRKPDNLNISKRIFLLKYTDSLLISTKVVYKKDDVPSSDHAVELAEILEYNLIGHLRFFITTIFTVNALE